MSYCIVCIFDRQTPSNSVFLPWETHTGFQGIRMKVWISAISILMVRELLRMTLGSCCYPITISKVKPTGSTLPGQASSSLPIPLYALLSFTWICNLYLTHHSSLWLTRQQKAWKAYFHLLCQGRRRWWWSSNFSLMKVGVGSIITYIQVSWKVSLLFLCSPYNSKVPSSQSRAKSPRSDSVSLNEPAIPRWVGGWPSVSSFLKTEWLNSISISTIQISWWLLDRVSEQVQGRLLLKRKEARKLLKTSPLSPARDSSPQARETWQKPRESLQSDAFL